jgi:hypothetical protein
MSQEDTEILLDAIKWANEELARWGAADRYWIINSVTWIDGRRKRVAQLVRMVDGFALHEVPVDDGHPEEVPDGLRYFIAIEAVVRHFEDGILKLLDPERCASSTTNQRIK